MDIIYQHINKNLEDFLNSQPSDEFNFVFEKLTSANKEKFKKILYYIGKIFEYSPEFELRENSNQISLKSLHLHFDIDIDINLKTVISEFLWYFFFIRSYRLDIKNEANLDLSNEMNKLQNVLESTIKLPYNCPKRRLNAINQERKKIRNFLKFYKELNINATLLPRTLINFKVLQENKLSELNEYNPCYININELRILNSYVLINSKSFDSIIALKLQNKPIFQILENIILFDCEDQIQKYNQFNFQYLNQLNGRFSCNLKNLVIISFGRKEQSISQKRYKTRSIINRYLTQEKNSYIILKPEIDFEFQKFNKINVFFLEPEKSVFWDSFLTEVNINSLYELRSFKLMNVYSICYSNEIKSYIMDQIFSDNFPSTLITPNTKQALFELSYTNINAIKNNLSSVLDLIINSNLKETVISEAKNFNSVIIDDILIKNEWIVNYLIKELDFNKNQQLKSWSNIFNEEVSNTLFLSYRDQGRYPNDFYPNLLEIQSNNNLESKAIFLKFLFEINYKWAAYNLNKSYLSYLEHPIRNKHFKWKDLKELVYRIKPERKPNFLDWNLEREYLSSSGNDTYRIKLSDTNRPILYNSSDLIIFSDLNQNWFRIERTNWFFDNVDWKDSAYSIQRLSDLLEEFNPAEKMIDASQQETDLEIIRSKFEIEYVSAEKIWKILLKRKSESMGLENLYSELKSLFLSQNISLVHLEYFKDSWININSDTIMPRGNKIAKVLFDYLRIGNAYLMILYRLKNASINGKIEATRKYSNLFKDLFADRCFDSEVCVQDILQEKIEKYQSDHYLEEIGIDRENPKKDLLALIDLIKPELNLKKLEFIERIL